MGSHFRDEGEINSKGLIPMRIGGNPPNLKYGDCIRCGYCCIKDPCGMTDNRECEHLSQVDGVHSCTHYPFHHLDTFTQECLAAGVGCGYGGENPMYKALWIKLKRERV